jgi:type II secretory pathway pseudopilin PulG
MKSRRGISLIELLLVMSAASVVLTMSATLIHRLMHAQSKASSLVDVERTALRLSEAFRSDVHRALRVGEFSAESVLVRLQMPGNQTIEYRSEPQAVRRVVSQGSETMARELFAFSATIKSEVRVSNSRLVTLLARPISDMLLDDRQPELLHVEAMLNRDTR